MTETRIHPVTGERLTRQVRTQKVAFGSLSREVEVPGWYPEGPGDAIHSGGDLAAEEAVFQELKKDYGERVRMIRKALKLTQVEAGQLIGGGPRAFQKYEKGVMPPSEAAVGLLEVLYRAPEMIGILKELRGAKGAPQDHTSGAMR
ncbi:type II TA system antitoxin MqsA family protein [Roseivivax sp.]